MAKRFLFRQAARQKTWGRGGEYFTFMKQCPTVEASNPRSFGVSPMQIPSLGMGFWCLECSFWFSWLAAKHEVGLVMVYENWVPGRVKVGELHLSRERITPADSVVAFFATSEASAVEIEQELLGFRKSLPPGVPLITRSDRGKTKAD